MKKLILLLALTLISSSVPTQVDATNKNQRFNFVVGTNSVAIGNATSGYNRFPLNTLVLKVFPDSINVQVFSTVGFGNAYGYAPVTQMDSFKHYQNNGTAFTSVSQVDSLFQAKFVK